MAKNIIEGDIVEYCDSDGVCGKYKVQLVSTNSGDWLIAGKGVMKSNTVNILQLKPLGNSFEVGGWVSERRVKLIKKSKNTELKQVRKNLIRTVGGAR